MRFPIGTSGQTLVLTDPVLARLDRHRQAKWWRREAGGQLFARFSSPDVVVELATGPRWSDRRSRFSYVPDRRAEQAEIDRENRKGRTYVGDWHTHPEASPAPSPRDIDSIRETFSESQLGLQGLILIIVGTTPVREDLYVGVCDRVTLTRLSITTEAMERGHSLAGVGRTPSHKAGQRNARA